MFSRSSRILRGFPLGFLLAAGLGQAAVSPHPRLILTPARLEALPATLTTTHRDLWAQVCESAEAFAAQTPPAMANASNRYRSFGDTLPALGLVFRLTGEPRYLAAADRWLQALVAVPTWRGSQNLGRSAWVVGSALLYDWLYEALPAATRARVRERLLAEGEILMVESSYWRLLSNHCLIESSALGLIGLALQGEDPRADIFLTRARERTELIIEHAPLDGTWGEGVQYWQYGLGYFLRYLVAAKTSGQHDTLANYEWLKRTGRFAIHFSLPGRPAESVNFSDSGTHDYVASFLHYLPASLYRDGYSQDYGDKTRSRRAHKLSWMDFLTYDPSVAPTDFRTLPTFAHFADNGFVIMRSGWEADGSLVAFHCGPAPGHRNQQDPRRVERRGFGPGHGHPDINSFCFFAHGQWLAIDPGYVHEKWTRDHNTILVNGQGQAGEGSEWLDYMAFESREPVPAILRAETTPEYDYVVGDAGNIYVDEAGLRHFRRHLLFLKPDIIVILDDLAGQHPSKFEWLLQAHDEARQTGPRQFEILRSGVRLSVQPQRPADFGASITRRPLRGSATAGQVTTLSVATESAGRTSFLVVLCALPDSTAPVPAVAWEGPRLCIRHGARSWNIAAVDPAPSGDPAARLLQPAAQ